MERTEEVKQTMLMESRALVSSRALLLGALGGLLGLLFVKTCELLVQGFMGGGFRLNPPEKITTAVLMLVVAALIYLIPSEASDVERLRRANDEELKRLAEDVARKLDRA
jgi:H+/Cl- antiporter ClcA